MQDVPLILFKPCFSIILGVLGALIGDLKLNLNFDLNIQNVESVWCRFSYFAWRILDFTGGH